MNDVSYVGLDVHKATISVAIANPGRDGEVRHVATITNNPDAIAKMVRQLSKAHPALEFVYEAGCCGYNIYRQIQGLGHTVQVCAPSLIPRRPGDRVKNDRRDAMSLARLLRAGELTSVWVPDPSHEALRDLVRTRHAASQDVRRGRIRIQAFLLRHDLRYDGKAWSTRHRRWLENRQFDHPSQQVALQFYINALEHDERHRSEIERSVRDFIAQSPWADQMLALQALKGVGPIVAATILAEVGDFSRFAHPRQLVSYFGLAPGEHSSGSSIRPRGITKAGSAIARSVLCEAAWNYRTTPKVGQWMKQHRPDVPQDIIDLAWKAQLRLHKTSRKLTMKGKKSVVVTAAVARELLCFIWSIGQRVPLQT